MAIIEAVLWDMDGVLLDSERLVRDIFVELMVADGVMTNPEEVYLQSIGLNQASILELYQRTMGSAERASYYFDKVGEVYKSRLASDLLLKPGVDEALQAVAEAGLPQMIVTSTRTETANLKLSHFDIRSYFCDIVGGDQVNKGKPNPEPYLLACQKLAIEPSRALVIEDSPNGVVAALAAGTAVIHVPDLIETDPQWQDQIYDALDSLESFPEWFEQQRGGDWV
ncbi:HAD family phosphatase [Reinekea sp. G2M2-21]|uniref:HAD family hydrolase n=1 Tax=Reinekea sp. G2M2-21 TaxID=2788942 RepID=UPI0018AAE020|nr:HAD family phosphatase [Reinekea sp. G2M2-21]